MTGPRGGARGAILVAVLVTSLALLLLALAGSTLALLHLQSARYEERAQRARMVARSGVALADAVLEERWARAGRLPDHAPSLPTGHGLEVRIVGYRRIDDGAAEVEVEGRSHGAVAVAGARLAFP